MTPNVTIKKDFLQLFFSVTLSFIFFADYYKDDAIISNLFLTLILSYIEIEGFLNRYFNADIDYSLLFVQQYTFML
jgi:hypothetical protein